MKDRKSLESEVTNYLQQQQQTEDMILQLTQIIVLMYDSFIEKGLEKEKAFNLTRLYFTLWLKAMFSKM